MLGMGKNTVEIIIAAKDRASAAFTKVNTRMKTMGGATGKLKSSMGGLTSKMSSLASSMNPVAIAAGAAGIALVTLGGAAIKASLDFEKASATIRVGTGATGEALAGLEESFKTVYTSVPASTADAATAIADLNTRLGLTAEPLEALASQFLNLSRITGTDVSSAISSATRVMHDFDVVASEQGASLDYLFKVSQSTGIGMTQLGNSMTQYGSVMRQMGFDINESAALLGKFEKEGVNLELVLGSLRQGLAKFSKAGEDPVDALARVSAEIQGMGSVADANALAIETFGARAGPDMAAAIREGRFSIEELMATLDASSETINKAAADTMTFGDKWTLLKNNVLAAIEPIGDVILNVLGGAMEAAGEVFNLLKDAVAGVKTALEPLTSKIEELKAKFEGGTSIVQLFSDIIVILKEGVTLLGEKIAWLLDAALTPFVAKLEAAIETLTAFYDKLGPIKTLIEGTKDAFGKVIEKVHDVRESIDEAKKPAEELGEALEEVGNAGKEASEVAVEAIEPVIEKTEEAIEKQKEFTVTIGDTTIKFKDATAEVVKNADAYEKLQKSAQTLIDLDWSTFTEFEAALPRIESGLGDLESSFVGFKVVLEDNVDKLENVKESVMDISEIAAPFLEAGFLKGIESIGSFAGTLKDAGSAINTFSSLQDVSIDACINFSTHVRDMVSALELLEGQMEDLVPDFAKMDSLITDIADAFLYGAGKSEVFESSFENMINNAYTLAEKGGMAFTEFSDIIDDAVSTEKINHIERYWSVVGSSTATATRESFLYMNEWAKGITGMGISFQEYYDILNMSSEEQEKWLYDFLHTNNAITFQMDKQTDALWNQTAQLNKITSALQPYLEFMRTLNELAALSTLSTDDLNNGLNAINDTLVNLGGSLETFDLRPVMEALFGTKITEGKDIGKFTGGLATGFIDTMQDFATPFSSLITYVERLTSSIFSLVSSFEALSTISESVLADQDKLKEVFEGITDGMTNFSTEMGGTEGFAQKFADGMDAMLKSAAPLIKYFQDNNAAVELFNKSLSSFRDTVTNVIGVFEDLGDMVKRSSELVVISAKEIETALSLVDDQLIEIVKYLESPAWGEIVTQLSAVSKEWEKWAVDVDNSMPAFNSAVDTFSTLISKILGLSSALKDMRDMSVLSVRDIDEALKNIPIFLDRFVDALALNMGEIKRTLKDLDREWELHTEEMKDTMPAYEDSTDKVGKLIGSLLSLSSTLKQLAEMGTISSKTFDTGFISLMSSISNFAVSLGRNVNGLIHSLQSLRTVWVDNEAVLFPLLRDFAIITDNLWGAAHNANRMADEFNDLRKNSIRLERGFGSLISFIDKVVEGTKEFYTIEAANEISRFLGDIGEVIGAFIDLDRKLKEAMGKIKTAIGTAVGNIKDKISSLDGLVRSAYYWGANMMIGFISGMYSMEEDLALAAARMAGIVKAYLGVSSNTERGYLKHLTDWGPNLVKTYADGIKSEMHTLDASFASMAPSMGAGTARVGGTNNVNLYVTQNIGSQADADYANQGLYRLLNRHEVM